MKKLILTILLALCTIGVFASTTKNALVIESVNGEKTYFYENDAKSFYYEAISFEIDPSSIDVLKGATKQLQAKFNDAEVPVIWTSSVESIATVDASGIVTGVADGTATITATYNGVSATSVIKVVDRSMVLVKAGTFEMGKNGDGTSDNVTPIHTVTLNQDFYICKYEVTQKLWQEVMGSNPSLFSTDGENKPVEQVNWYDCIEFCNALSEKDGYDKVYNIDKVNIDPNNTCDYGCIKWTVTINASANGYRLPTEAQWEYASKGGDKASSPYKISSGSDAVDAVAWYYGNSGGETHQVGRKASNELGIYDMTGNVYEWCFDWYGDYSAYAQTDPVGVVSGVNRVVRGGGYNVYDYCCRSAFRNNNAPDHKLFNYGLRVVRLVP